MSPAQALTPTGAAIAHLAEVAGEVGVLDAGANGKPAACALCPGRVLPGDGVLGLRTHERGYDLVTLHADCAARVREVQEG